VKEIAVSKFKATCLAVIAEVQRTRKPVRVTRFGKPVAEIVPASVPKGKSWLGSMRGMIEVDDDIVGPIGAFDGWDVEEP
jgi:prevent-host-death family protein